MPNASKLRKTVSAVVRIKRRDGIAQKVPIRLGEFIVSVFQSAKVVVKGAGPNAIQNDELNVCALTDL
jgi:hypothetical protein